MILLEFSLSWNRGLDVTSPTFMVIWEGPLIRVKVEEEAATICSPAVILLESRLHISRTDYDARSFVRAGGSHKSTAKPQ